MPVEALGERLWLLPLLTMMLEVVATYQLGTRTKKSKDWVALIAYTSVFPKG